MPTISPPRTVKLTSWVVGLRVRLRTSSTSPRTSLGSLGKSSVMVRPTIMRMSSPSLTSATGFEPTKWPSRSTVTRSASSKTSWSRWLM